MKQKLTHSWSRVPSRIRRPIVFIIGGFFVLLSGTVGWLPGPGGIPIFLLGIAILSTEFMWAERVKKVILMRVRTSAQWIKQHQIMTALLVVITLALSFSIAYMLIYTR